MNDDHEYEVVRTARELRLLAKLGEITEPPAHVRPRPGRWGRDYHYVNDVDGGVCCGVWKKVGRSEYRLRYFDGCFFPFLLRRKRNENEQQ